jgi:putative transposase
LGAIKSYREGYSPSGDVIDIMSTFTRIVNVGIERALEKNITSRNSLSEELYKDVKNLPIPSYYIPPAIAKAVSLVKSYRKSVRKESRKKRVEDRREIRKPHVNKLFLTTHYGFVVKNNTLSIPIGRERYSREYTEIPLNDYVSRNIRERDVRSFTITEISLVVTVENHPDVIECDDVEGIDRNLNNVTIGNEKHREIIDLSAVPRIKEKYRRKQRHFRRNDHRIRKNLYLKYGTRSSNRTDQILHTVSKNIVQDAVDRREAIALEDLTDLNKRTHRGDGKGRDHRFMMVNSFPYGRLAQFVKYKAEWIGLPVIQLSREDTKGTSIDCSVCGYRTQENGRMLHCPNCNTTIHRDVNAAINIAARGRTWLKRSSTKGQPIEAMNQSKDGELMVGSQSTKI